MVDAFRARNMHVGLYHSLIDWHHPDYILDPHIGPYRDHPDREKLNVGRKQALRALGGALRLQAIGLGLEEAELCRGQLGAVQRGEHLPAAHLPPHDSLHVGEAAGDGRADARQRAQGQ